MPNVRLLSWLATWEFQLMPKPKARALIKIWLSNLITNMEGIKRFSILTTWYGHHSYLHLSAFIFIDLSNYNQKLSRTIDSILSMSGLSRLLIRCVSTENTIRHRLLIDLVTSYNCIICAIYRLISINLFARVFTIDKKFFTAAIVRDIILSIHKTVTSKKYPSTLLPMAVGNRRARSFLST